MNSDIIAKGDVLDNQEKIKLVDSQNQFQLISSWPNLITEVMRNANQLDLPKKIKAGSRTLDYQQIFSSILFCGMGGSAIGGSYTETILQGTLDVPLLINRKHTLPSFVGPSTLVIICSYSGNTEETVQVFLEALKQGAPIVLISSGGMLMDFCEHLGLPVVRLEPGYQPRASFPLLFPPIPVVLSRLLKSYDFETDFREAINVLRDMKEQIGPNKEWSDNKAKQIAGSIAGTVPMVCSSIGCLAYRMRCQLNENSKLPAVDLEFPELGHNHIVGLESHPRNLSQFSLVHLALNSEKQAILIRMEYLKELASKVGISVHNFEAQGRTLLAQMLSLTYFGDYVSLYVAVLRGVDPSPVATIARMKERIDKECPWKDEAERRFRSIIR